MVQTAQSLCRRARREARRGRIQGGQRRRGCRGPDRRDRPVHQRRLRRDRHDRQQLDVVRSGDGPRRRRERGCGPVRRGRRFGQGHHGQRSRRPKSASWPANICSATFPKRPARSSKSGASPGPPSTKTVPQASMRRWMLAANGNMSRCAASGTRASPRRSLRTPSRSTATSPAPTSRTARPGLVRALIETKHGFIPVAGQAENGFKKMCVEYKDQGLTCASVGQVPSLVAIAMKAAISAAKGNVMPQFISAPIPYSDTESLKAGVNYFPDLPDSFYTNNEFPACNITHRREGNHGADEGQPIGRRCSGAATAIQPMAAVWAADKIVRWRRRTSCCRSGE